MPARLSRTVYTSVARRGLLSGSTSSASRMSWRRMGSTSSHEPTKSNDLPWVIGSLLIFGPAFLYLLSPSAKKKHHFEHKDKHDFPALLQDEHSKVLKDKAYAHISEPATEAEKPEPELMKDDDGTVVDVASSIALAESSDVPNDAQSPEDHAALKSAAKNDSSDLVEEEPTPEVGNTENSTASSSPGEDKEGPKTPTHMGEARKTAVEHVTPKEGSERKN